jgi:hypothetical protein
VAEGIDDAFVRENPVRSHEARELARRLSPRGARAEQRKRSAPREQATPCTGGFRY